MERPKDWQIPKVKDEGIKKNFVWCESIEDLENYLRTDYALSIRDICCMMKFSRTTFNKYIRPHVRWISIDNSMRGDKLGNDTSMKLLYYHIDLDDIRDSVKLNSGDFYKLITSNIKTIRQRVKEASFGCFIAPEDKAGYLDSLGSYRSEIEHIRDEKEISDYDKMCIIKERTLEFDEYTMDLLNEYGKKHFLEKDLKGKFHLLKTGAISSQRTKYEWIDVSDEIEVDESIISSWTTYADSMEYGDTAEGVARRFFKRGMINVKLTLPSSDGEVSKEFSYYAEDPFSIRKDLPDDRFFPYPLPEWRKYMKWYQKKYGLLVL